MLPPEEDIASEQSIEETSLLIEVSARILCNSSDAPAFLDWIADAGPRLAPQFAAMVDPGTGTVERVFRAMGVSIYNAMPLPEADFRPRPLPRPGRNDPCWCGSGAKFKHCCQRLGDALDVGQVNFLTFVLKVLPKKRMRDLPDSKVDPAAVAQTAMEWADAGEIKDAVALLEPWFAPGRKLHAKLEPLFDQLMEGYLELGQARKREKLIEALLASGDKALRSAALQRRATMLSDEGRQDESWAVFLQAQREDPDHPGIGFLEVTLLLGKGDTRQARERARFWAARLERMRDPEMQPAIQFMREVAADPAAAFAKVGRERAPEVDRLMRLFEAAPAPAAHYGAEVEAGEAMLVCDDALAPVEAKWRACYPQEKPYLTMTQLGSSQMWAEAGDWLDFLERTPLAWQSLDVLDDLAMAAEVVAQLGLDLLLLDPLLARGSAVLEANLAAIGLTGTLPWSIGQNRPALRMLAHQAFRLEHQARSDDAARARFIVCAQRLLALNPSDNHGVRGPLSRAYLESGDAQQALDLCERFADDHLCDIPLNRVLALYRLGLRGDALSMLAASSARIEATVQMLLAANPKTPRASGYGVTLGGKEAAWAYRVDHLALWQRDEALKWLRSAWRAARKKD